MRRVKHAAVPPEMTETAYDVAMSGFAFGLSPAGPSESCARAAGTDDGDLSEPILACVCVRVGGDRGEWGGAVRDERLSESTLACDCERSPSHPCLLYTSPSPRD